MKIYTTKSIQSYVHQIIVDDKEISNIIDHWNLEKEDIEAILINFFNELGIYVVYPQSYERLIYQSILFQLRNSPDMKHKLAIVQAEIERMRAKQRS